MRGGELSSYEVLWSRGSRLLRSTGCRSATSARACRCSSRRESGTPWRDLVREVRDGAVFDADAIREFSRGTLAAYKVPKRIEQMDDLPRSLVGKVQRREVIALLG